MAGKTIFLTGITGFLGSHLAYKFLKNGYKVIALVRNSNGDVYPLNRAINALSDVADTNDIPLENLRVISGDIRDDWTNVKKKVGNLSIAIDEVWHCATTFKFLEKDREEIIAHNIVGTTNMLELTLNINNKRPPRFVYVSTAYVCGKKRGMVFEKINEEANSFHNLYEWSKYEAECIVNDYRKDYGVETIIFRPTVIIGDSVTGKATNFTGYYGVCNAIYRLCKGLEVNLGSEFDRTFNLRILANPETKLNLVPVNYVVKAMYLLSNVRLNGSFLFHIANAEAPELELVKKVVCEDLDISGIELVMADDFNRLPMTGLERVFHNKIGFQSPYLLLNSYFDMTNLKKALSSKELINPIIDENMLHKINKYYFSFLDSQLKCMKNIKKITLKGGKSRCARSRTISMGV